MRVRIRVHGRVQGVFFRVSAEREAARLHVAGFARNERDGSVTVEAEGERAAVEAMIAWCRAGPSRARVERIELTDLDPTGRRGFDAR